MEHPLNPSVALSHPLALKENFCWEQALGISWHMEKKGFFAVTDGQGCCFRLAEKPVVATIVCPLSDLNAIHAAGLQEFIEKTK